MSRSNGNEKGILSPRVSGRDDCIILEKAHTGGNYPRGHPMFAWSEEEERMPGNNLGLKRSHMETKSPINECTRSPLIKEDNGGEVSGNGFVTARAKLV